MVRACRACSFFLAVIGLLGLLPGCMRDRNDDLRDCWEGQVPEGALRLPNGGIVFPSGSQVPVLGFPQGLALSPDGRTLIATLNGLGRVYPHSLLTMDTGTGSVHYLAFPTLFLGLAVSPDGTRVYASGGGDNTVYILGLDQGRLSYEGRISVAGFPAGLTVSPTGEILAACSMDNTVKVLSPSLMAVTMTLPVGSYPWTITGSGDGDKFYVADRGDGSVTSISARTGVIKTIRFAEESQPASLTVSPDGGMVYVAHAASDTLGVIIGGPDLLGAVYSLDPAPSGVLGGIPSALAISPDGRRLFVALSGENAVGVYALPDMTLQGKIPTGWYPSSVVVSPDGGRLYVANAKGTSLFSLFPEATGSITIVDVPEGPDLVRGIREVDRNSCTGAFPGKKISGMKYITNIVVIVREGKTFDSLFGDLGPSAFGDPNRARFPADITPNAHVLAGAYALAPFFFADGEAAPQNRQWRVAAYTGDFLERTWPSSYGEHNRPPDDLGPLAQSPAGTIFESCLRAAIPVKVYGESLPVLQTITNSTYAAAISDVARANVFISDLKTYVTNWSLPRLIYIFLPPSCPDPAVPCTQDPSVVKEEDVATGMIVQSLSASPYWGNMAVFLLESSPPADADDSVDGHRTGCVLISPFAKRGHVSTLRYSLPSLLRTIEVILGRPPLSRFDGNARLMDDLFSEEFFPGPFTATTQ